jgi:integrase/recombinase XerD
MTQLTYTPTLETTQMAIAVSTFDILNLWLFGKSANTQKAYRRDVLEFVTFTSGKELNQITLNDLQSYVNALGSLGHKQTTINRKLAAVKSLFTFMMKSGLVKVNPTALVTLKPVKDKLSERILTESEVLKIIYSATEGRDQLILKFLYATGCRVSELVNLTWQDVSERNDGNYQVTLFGKGNKTRTVILHPELSKELREYGNGRSGATPVFRSQKKGHLVPKSINRILERATKKAGINKKVSPHWLRHSHASHSLERGASVELVRQTLGHSDLTVTSRYLHARPNDSSSLYLVF